MWPTWRHACCPVDQGGARAAWSVGLASVFSSPIKGRERRETNLGPFHVALLGERPPFCLTPAWPPHCLVEEGKREACRRTAKQRREAESLG